MFNMLHYRVKKQREHSLSENVMNKGMSRSKTSILTYRVIIDMEQVIL